MENKALTTPETSAQEVSEAPEYLRPFTEVSDLDHVTIEAADGSLDTAFKQFLQAGGDVTGLTDQEMEIMKHQYEGFYHDYYIPERESDLDQQANKAYEKFQEEEKKAAREEGRIPHDYETDKEYKEKFISNYKSGKRQEETDFAARMGIHYAFENRYDSEQAGNANRQIETFQKQAETKNKINEALKFQQQVDFEYLTQGALLMCTGGKVWRRLNMPADHGVFYGEEESPVVNMEDDRVGDLQNITTFGICDGSNPPAEVVTLESLTLPDENGMYMEEHNEDAVKTGPRCIPEIVEPGWINTYSETEIGTKGKAAVSTKSFLVCIHGGIIYPLNSGQHSQQQAKLDNAIMKGDFDALCEAYGNLEQAEAELKIEVAKPQNNQGSYLKIAAGKGGETSPRKQLKEVQKAKSVFKNKLGDCLEQAREDSYKGAYKDISDERKDTLNYMLGTYADMFGGEKASVKSDYYWYRRRYGGNSQSDYWNDNPGFTIGSDEYINWRAGNMERTKGKEKKAEYEAWKADVDVRGYENISAWEKEEFDRAGREL